MEINPLWRNLCTITDIVFLEGGVVSKANHLLCLFLSLVAHTLKKEIVPDFASNGDFSYHHCRVIFYAHLAIALGIRGASDARKQASSPPFRH